MNAMSLFMAYSCRHANRDNTNSRIILHGVQCLPFISKDRYTSLLSPVVSGGTPRLFSQGLVAQSVNRKHQNMHRERARGETVRWGI